MTSELTRKPFSQIPLTNPFFDSLREDYPGFDAWFARKADESAYVFTGEAGAIEGFLYLKEETAAVEDVVPPFPAARRIKIGTFKVLPHGTRMGERFMKKALDHAVEAKAKGIYVTVFPRHQKLIEIFVKYGFEKVAEKPGPAGTEHVYARPVRANRGDILRDYPMLHRKGVSKYLLGIHPEWHTRLLPDSKLHNEPPDIIEDVSHTNSIHKVYLTSMKGTEALHRGDLLVLYRTSDGAGPALYRSVVTSVGVVEEVRHIDTFTSIDELLDYCEPYSVFSEEELRAFWARRNYKIFIRFTYNAALKRRITRGELIDRGLIGTGYAGFMPLTDDQFDGILREGGVDAGLVVD